MTQAALAERLNTTQSQIDKLEKGLRGLSDVWIVKFTGFFGCTADYLLGLTDDTGNVVPPATNIGYEPELVRSVAWWLAKRRGDDPALAADLFIELCEYLQKQPAEQVNMDNVVSIMEHVVGRARR